MDDKTMRLDKWLWAARFYKTRALAQKAIHNSQVLVDNQKSTPARSVKTGSMLTIKRGDDCRIFEIKGLSATRGPYEKAKLLYEETADSIKANEIKSEQRANQKLATPTLPNKRPDKKSRKQLRGIKRSE